MTSKLLKGSLLTGKKLILPMFRIDALVHVLEHLVETLTSKLHSKCSFLEENLSLFNSALKSCGFMSCDHMWCLHDWSTRSVVVFENLF